MQLTERCWLSKEKPQAGKPRHPEAQSVKEVGSFFFSQSIRRFWGKGERWKRKRERGEGRPDTQATFFLKLMIRTVS